MPTTAWSTQQLAEFVAAVSAAESEPDAALAAVERAAEALNANVAAIVAGGEVVAEVGYAGGTAAAEDLEAVQPALASCSLEVPGVGTCTAAAAALEHPPGATLVVARPGRDRLTRDESGLLRGMARVASLTMRMQRVLDEERAARERLEELAREQAALRRVATLVARAAAPADLFAAVAQEVASVFTADVAFVGRYDSDGGVEFVGGWTGAGRPSFIGGRVSLGGHNVSTLVFERNQPVRIDHLADDGTPATVLAREFARAAGAPISVEGRLWGAMVVGSSHEDGLAAGTEHRLAEFTELVATAIANADAHAELVASRARIIATADEIRRRIERDLHDGAQSRLVALALQLRAAQTSIPPELDQLSEKLDEVAAGLNGVLDELRDYTRGIHPATLAQGGLAAALKALARRSAVPVELGVQTTGRLPEQIEVGAYYVVSETLANAAKHAEASVAAVRVEAVDGVLRISVRDDGVGGAVFAHGSGLAGLKDRVEALGGWISLESPRGAGTSIAAELPLPANAAELPAGKLAAQG
jgi:signal transduction histidine kinase